jgi:hypothetical protein
LEGWDELACERCREVLTGECAGGAAAAVVAAGDCHHEVIERASLAEEAAERAGVGGVGDDRARTASERRGGIGQPAPVPAADGELRALLCEQWRCAQAGPG